MFNFGRNSVFKNYMYFFFKFTFPFPMSTANSQKIFYPLNILFLTTMLMSFLLTQMKSPQFLHFYPMALKTFLLPKHYPL